MLSDRIPYYILDLLQLTPSVHVEGLGRFEAIFHSAKMDATNASIAPPHIQGAFDPESEGTNDVLEAFILYTSGEQSTSPKEGIADFVKTVEKQTAKGEPYTIDKFGTFVKSDQGILRFTPDWDAFNISFKGLEPVALMDKVEERTQVAIPTPPAPYIPKASTAISEDSTGDIEKETAAAASIAMVNQTKEALEKDLDKIDPSNSKLWWGMLISAMILIAVLCVYLAWDIMSNRKRLDELRQAHADTIATIQHIKNADSLTVANLDDIPEVESSGTDDSEQQDVNNNTDTEPPCFIVVGAFGDPANVDRMKNRLESMQYAVEEIKGKTLTKVAIRTSCDQGNLQRVLDEVRSSVNPEAWIY